MVTTIQYPADPVTQGATEIQVTCFANDMGDYSYMTWNAVQEFVRKKDHKFRGFPTGAENPKWTFYGRNDLAGTSSGLRNIIGIHVSLNTDTTNSFSPTQSRSIVVPNREHTVQVVNWAPYKLTLSDGTVITRFIPYSISATVVEDPETQDYILDASSLPRAVYEAMGFLFTQSAASLPSSTPLTNALSGISPLG